MSREVWISHEATMSVFEQDASGNPITPAIYEEIFVQDASAKPIRTNITQRQPGVAFEESESFVIGHEIRIGALFWRKAKQVTPFLDGSKKFRILLELVNPQYDGVAPEENDTFDYRGCSPIEGPDWKLRDNDVLTSEVALRAERLI